MKYIILDDFEIKNLEEKVNSHIQEGFKPVGSVSAVNHKEGFIEYLQSMVKENH